MASGKPHTEHTFISSLESTILAFAILVSNVSAAAPHAPCYAYITNSFSNSVSIIDTNTNTVNGTVNYVLETPIPPAAAMPHTIWMKGQPYGVAANPDGTKAYVTHQSKDAVSVIYGSNSFIAAWVKVGSHPLGVAVNPQGTKVYVANSLDDTVSVINAATNNVTATVPVGDYPLGVATSPDGTKVYVANSESNNVSVIDTATDKVIAKVPVGQGPQGVAVTPDGKKVYVTTRDNVSVINTATNTIIAIVPVGQGPRGVAVTPDGKKAYVTIHDNVSVIDTESNTVKANVSVGTTPAGIAVSPDGKVYVANMGSKNVSVIDTATDTVIAEIKVGMYPYAFGQFIGTASSQQVLPVANFISNVTVGSAPLSVQFNDSSENATSWYWDFGEECTSTEQNPVHTYDKAGYYNVNLTVSNAKGNDSKIAVITALEASSGFIGEGRSHSNVDNLGKAHVISNSGNYISNLIDNMSTTAAANVTQTEGNASVPEQNNGSTAVNVEQSSGQKNRTSTPAKENKKTPGFEIILNMTSLLPAYLCRRR